jgi:hypothetical protein
VTPFLKVTAAEMDAFGVVYPHPKNQLKSIALPSSPKFWGNSSQVFEIPMLILSRFASPSASAKGSTSNAHRSNRWALLAKPVLGVALAMGVLSAGQAQAFVVNVGGQDYDVTTFAGTYTANKSKFAKPANGGDMPWWGNADLAYSFALSVDHSLSSINDIGRLVGPLFADKIRATNLGNTPGPAFYVKVDYGFYYGNFDSQFNETQATWAQAVSYRASASSVPGPLPALGAAAAFGFSRKLRKRIKRSNNAVSSSYNL